MFSFGFLLSLGHGPNGIMKHDHHFIYSRANLTNPGVLPRRQQHRFGWCQILPWVHWATTKITEVISPRASKTVNLARVASTPWGPFNEFLPFPGGWFFGDAFSCGLKSFMRKCWNNIIINYLEADSIWMKLIDLYLFERQLFLNQNHEKSYR